MLEEGEENAPMIATPMFHIGWAHEREVVMDHSIALHKIVLN